MGSDRSLSEVMGVDVDTGWPRDKHGHLLDPFDEMDDSLIPGWNEIGTELPVATDPYGSLRFGIGTDDDFVCLGYRIVQHLSDRGEWNRENSIVLHSVINSETGAFIQDFTYEIASLATYDRNAAYLVDEALEWLAANDLKHSKAVWRQDPWFFLRAVHCSIVERLFDTSLPFSDRERRFGGRKINTLCGFAFP